MSNQQKDPSEFILRLSLRLSWEDRFKKARKQIILKRNFDFHLCPTQIT